jgi:reverse transcriptase-like protein
VVGRPIDWARVIDLDQALINCHDDIRGDWYRDPWGWPELDWVVASRPALALERAGGAGVRRSMKLDVPKENYATRPAMVMDPLDRLVYQALVDRVSKPAIEDLRSWVFGWRLPRTNAEAGRYSPNKSEWKWYRSRLVQLSEAYQFGLTTDVVSFFASIPISRLIEVLRSRSRSGVVDRIEDLLTSWDGMQGRHGLPQRFLASSVLASMYLHPLDTIVDGAAARPTLTLPFPGATRWMDDVWVFGAEEPRLREAQVRVEQLLRDLGLNMGTGKTKLLEGDELIAAARELEHSAAEEGLDEEPIDPRGLDDLITRLLAAPETASRSSVRFATKLMREHALWRRVGEFADVAVRMPHCADVLARLFRDSEAWRDLTGWYLDYVNSPWVLFAWSVGQMATMFPADGVVPRSMQTYMAEKIVARSRLPVLAVASHRLASWDSDAAKQSIRAVAGVADHPLERRVLAFASLMAGDERAFVRGLVREFDDNRPAFEMLEDQGYRVPHSTPDFAG